MGWLARSYRMVSKEVATLDSFISKSKIPLSKSMVSMLETGSRRWSRDIMMSFESALDLKGDPIQRACLAMGCNSVLLGVDADRAADLLDDIISGDIESVSPLDLVRTIVWVTQRNDPLGERSWSRLIKRYADRTCDTKGVISQECDQALPFLATHSKAKRHYFEYVSELAVQVGHPKSFVPITALQADGAYVDLAGLMRQIRRPDNRWLIREHLNLAAAKLSDSKVRWTASQVVELDKVAHEWRTDSASEAEVVRAAAYLQSKIKEPRAIATKIVLPCLTWEFWGDKPEGGRLVREIAVLAGVSREDERLLGILSSLIGMALYGQSDRLRSLSTRVLASSCFRGALCDRSREVLNASGGSMSGRRDIAPWARLLGKLGSNESDAKAIWQCFFRSTDSVLLEVLAWALCDISAVAFPSGCYGDLSALPSRYLKKSNGSISRALISAFGRARKWEIIEEVSGVGGEVSAELRWWLDRRRN